MHYQSKLYVSPTPVWRAVAAAKYMTYNVQMSSSRVVRQKV